MHGSGLFSIVLHSSHFFLSLRKKKICSQCLNCDCVPKEALDGTSMASSLKSDKTDSLVKKKKKIKKRKKK